MLASIFTHKLVKLVDHDAISKLERVISEIEGRAPESGLLMAAAFCWHTKNTDEARRYVQKAQDANPSSTEANVLRGWIDVSCSVTSRKERDIFTKSVQYFDNILGEDGSKSQRDLEALLGKAKFFEKRKLYDKALEYLNQAIVVFSWYTPALLEKARILAVMGDWEQSQELAQRVSFLDFFIFLIKFLP